MTWLQCAPNYEVSDLGQVRNIKTQRILKPWRKGNYHGCNIIGFAKKPKVYIHHVVARTFLPAPTDKCEIDHIDRNRYNNAASNLRWVSSSENQRNKNPRTEPNKHNKLGHQYIHVYKGKFKVLIHNLRVGYYYSLHDTLNAAIESRDKVINAFQDPASTQGEPPVLRC